MKIFLFYFLFILGNIQPQQSILQRIFTIENENGFLIEEEVLNDAFFLIDELKKIAKTHKQGQNIIDIVQEIGLKIRSLNYEIKALEGHELFSTSIRHRVLDCDKLSMIFYILTEEFKLPIQIILLPDHLMLKFSNFEELYWETTSNRLVNMVEFKERYPEQYNHPYVIKNYSEFMGLNYFNVGLAHMNIGKSKRALNLFNLSKQFFPKFSENDFAIANIHMQSLFFFSAIQYYELCLKQNPNHYNAKFNLALSYKEIKRYDLALQQFMQCKSYPLNDPNLNYQIALTHQSLENYNDAISYLKLSLKENSDKKFIYIQLAELYHFLRRYEDETEIYVFLYKQNKNDKNLILKLAFLYGLQKKFEESDYFKRLAQNF